MCGIFFLHLCSDVFRSQKAPINNYFLQSHKYLHFLILIIFLRSFFVLCFKFCYWKSLSLFFSSCSIQTIANIYSNILIESSFRSWHEIETVQKRHKLGKNSLWTDYSFFSRHFPHFARFANFAIIINIASQLER